MAQAVTALRYRREARILDVTFADGAQFALPAELLRVESPSAEVQGHGPGQKVIVAGRRHVGIMRIEPVGHYAVKLVFDDGHATGLYSWNIFYDLGVNQEQNWQDYLRRLAEVGYQRQL